MNIEYTFISLTHPLFRKPYSPKIALTQDMSLKSPAAAASPGSGGPLAQTVSTGRYELVLHQPFSGFLQHAVVLCQPSIIRLSQLLQNKCESCCRSSKWKCIKSLEPFCSWLNLLLPYLSYFGDGLLLTEKHPVTPLSPLVRAAHSSNCQLSPTDRWKVLFSPNIRIH